MSVNLEKGGRQTLQKNGEGAGSFTIGLGWDTSHLSGVDFDLDVSGFLLGLDGKSDHEGKGFLFFNNKDLFNGAIIHSGDNRTGDATGDDESIIIDLSKIDPQKTPKFIVLVTVYDAAARRQNFGQVNNAYVRVLNNSGVEVCKYDLTEDFSSVSMVIVCEIYYHAATSEWKFKAAGEGQAGDLSSMCNLYGVSV